LAHHVWYAVLKRCRNCKNMFVTLNFAGGRDNQCALTSLEQFIPLPDHFLQRCDVPTIWYKKCILWFSKYSFFYGEMTCDTFLAQNMRTSTKGHFTSTMSGETNGWSAFCVCIFTPAATTPCTNPSGEAPRTPDSCSHMPGVDNEINNQCVLLLSKEMNNYKYVYHFNSISVKNFNIIAKRTEKNNRILISI